MNQNIEQVEPTTYSEDFYILQRAFCKGIHTYLKSRIKGRIFVEVPDGCDYMDVRITSVNDFRYQFRFDDIFRCIINGVPANKIGEYIFDDFKRSVMKYYIF